MTLAPEFICEQRWVYFVHLISCYARTLSCEPEEVPGTCWIMCALPVNKRPLVSALGRDSLRMGKALSEHDYGQL